ncbi:alpha/beta fold hydrolase [Nocardioides limicola]|uniref:alpha/beta fold hydrolase n=1 Tax=Nocardioides limicola TaxID=2803368 RepID=UPI00193B3801|nr:alpha/beta fold hydrolase [Nocardioides sp. DJM-14]
MRIESWQHDGLTFEATDSGPLDGPIVVLLHGFPQRRTCWRQVAALLNDRGVRTIAPDLRGYSPGARPKRRRDYRLPLLVGDVAALLECTGPAHLVGHDWGATVAWGTAATRQESVRSLTAVSVAHPRAFLGSMLRSTQLARSWYMGFFQIPFLPELMMRRPAAYRRSLSHAGMTEAQIEEYVEGVLADGALRGGLGYYRGLPLTWPLAAELGPVSVPTTMVWSDDDVALVRKGIDLTPRHVHADYDLVVLPGVSHWIPEEAPEALAQAILGRVEVG